MLYYLFTYLRDTFHLAGAGVFNYITFRVAMAIILSLVISMLMGKRLISFLQRKQIGETVRELGLQGEAQKRGTPTMGGLIDTHPAICAHIECLHSTDAGVDGVARRSWVPGRLHQGV